MAVEHAPALADARAREAADPSIRGGWIEGLATKKPNLKNILATVIPICYGVKITMEVWR